MAKKKSSTSALDMKNLKFYYGIPHSHCSFSTGAGTPVEAFEHARHNGLDFLIITDHNNHLAKNVTVRGREFNKWDTEICLAQKYNKKHENFLGLIGFESKTSIIGDINIINSDKYFTGIVSSFQALILWMFNNPSAFVTINHPHREAVIPPFSPFLNRIITSVEVGNGSAPNKYQRYEAQYYNYLDNGWKLGAINSQDNHKMTFGDEDNLTCIIANSLNPVSLVNAFRARHTYSTESRTLSMYFFINEYFMGSSMKLRPEEMNFSIYAKDPDFKIMEIDIITNRGTVIKKAENLNLNRVKYLYKHIPSPEEHWYVVKIILENNKVAISSPIFV